jgi:hypothetical protein
LAQTGTTDEEVRRDLATRGLAFDVGTIERFFARHTITRKKKTSHVAEQDRPEVSERR